MDVSMPDWMPAPVSTPGAAPDATRMDAVELLVHDLDAMTGFYSGSVTLDVLDQSAATTTLGSGGVPIVVLRQQKNLPGRDRRGAGLYHSAILFADRTRLAIALESMARQAGHLYEGSADHLVSEAFYFRDPEGNGIELYRDIPREKWQIGPDGTVRMGALPLDPHRFLAEWFDPDAADRRPSAAIGHIHLQVGDIPTARRFYEGVLGFDVTLAFDSALFLSAGGYHHHLGMNTWHSAGAGPRAATLGLGEVRILVPTRDDVAALAERLRHHRLDAADDGLTLRVADPWGTRLVVTPEAA